MNHTGFPKEDHLPNWARRDIKVTKGDRVEEVMTASLPKSHEEYKKDLSTAAINICVTATLKQTFPSIPRSITYIIFTCSHLFYEKVGEANVFRI